jgi:[ribosomal protein S18]-alanine N-acetyltransferase
MTAQAVSTDADLCALAHLHAACFEDSWSEQALRDLLKTAGTTAFAAQDGFVMTRVAGGEAEILTLAVAATARRKGIGHSLMMAALRHAQSQGAQTMFLEVAEANVAAAALYTGLGFREVGRRKSYYAPSEDALILRVDLPAPAIGKSKSFD